MKRITYAVTAMAFASVFSALTGKFSEIVFLSAIFSVILTVSRSPWARSILLWTLSFYALLLPVFVGIYPEFVISSIIGHFSYAVMKALEGNLNFVPSKPIVLTLNLPEKTLFAASFFVFLGALICI